MQAQVHGNFLSALGNLQCGGTQNYLVVIICALAVLGLVWMPLGMWLAARRRSPRIDPRRQAELDGLRSARRDQLTQLQNRAAFQEALARRLQLGTRSALLLIDIDRFKAINCTHGHRLGDELLVSIAARLRQFVPEPDQVARLNGDEFAILLDAARGRDDVESAALNITRALLGPISAGLHTIDCSASIGVALMPDHGIDAESVLRVAHGALDEVKASGGGGFRFHNPAHKAAERERQELKEDLKAAIPAGLIIPHYQPIVDLRTGVMIGLEVLARWQHPQRGLLAPDVFIPLAEEMHLAGQITQALMRRVVRDARDWPSWVYFALNVSPGQLREMISMLRDPPLWPEGEIDPTRLEIEVTETALIEDIDLAREMMGLLQARGTRVVLDDFGTGYSNINHLRELPFDRIKIDKSFVLASEKDSRAEACIRAMLALGGSLGIEMVAEGIETKEVADHLARLGCRYGQGYLYSEPVPAQSVFNLMRRLRQGAEAVA